MPFVRGSDAGRGASCADANVAMTIYVYCSPDQSRMTFGHLAFGYTANRGAPFMANGTSKADLQDQVDLAIDVLDDAYAPESTREDLAEAVGNALDILRGESEDDDDDDDLD
jgi:hypothetical protein